METAKLHTAWRQVGPKLLIDPKNTFARNRGRNLIPLRKNKKKPSHLGRRKENRRGRGGGHFGKFLTECTASLSIKD